MGFLRGVGAGAVVMTWMGLWCFSDGVLAVACKAAGGSEPADVGYQPGSQDTPLLVTPAHSALLCSSLSGGCSCPCGVFLGLSCPGGSLDDWGLGLMKQPYELLSLKYLVLLVLYDVQ